MDARCDLELLAVVDPPELSEGGLRVVGIVERLVQLHVEVWRLRVERRLRIGQPNHVVVVAQPAVALRYCQVRLDRAGRLRASVPGVIGDIARAGQLHGGLERELLAVRLLGGTFRMPSLEPRRALGELPLQLARVEQHEGRQLDGSLRRPDRTLEPFLHDVRNQPAVIEVRVCQQDRVDFRRVVGERNPVPDRLVGAALEHAAVDEDPRAIGGEQELRAGDSRGGAEELNLHAGAAVSRPGSRSARRRRPPGRAG